MAAIDTATTHADSALEDRVRRFFARPEIADRGLAGFSPMADGHAGLAYGVDLCDAAGRLDRYVLKLAPAGVRRSGSTDIFRQASLLGTLHAAGLPVPEVRWSSAGDDELGAPFIVMTRLKGLSYIVWQPDCTFTDTPAALPELWLDGARALARLHAVDDRRLLADWEQPTSLGAEIDRWSGLIRHSEPAGWAERLDDLGSALLRAKPDDAPIGLIHGDFQPGNIVFADGAISGIIDWDLAAVGPQGTDLGWYLMMADADNWHAAWRPVGPAPRDAIVAAYAGAGGRALADLAWHQAFAHFRLGAIAGLNLKLHRSGRRTDDVWERFAIAIPGLLRAAFDLLDGTSEA